MTSGMEVAMSLAPTRAHAIHVAAERLKNALTRNLMDSAAFAKGAAIILTSNPRICGKSQHKGPPPFKPSPDWWWMEPPPEVSLADALERARRNAAPTLTVALANKLMRDAHKRGDARTFNAAREALRSV